MERDDGLFESEESFETRAQLLAERRSDDIGRDAALLHQEFPDLSVARSRQAQSEMALQCAVDEPSLSQDLAEGGHASRCVDCNDLAARKVDAVGASRNLGQPNEPGDPAAMQGPEHVAECRLGKPARNPHASFLLADAPGAK